MSPLPDAQQPAPWPVNHRAQSWPIDRLVPYETNARTHSDKQIRQIAESIKEWGWTMPVLATKAGGIIAGHGRVAAAKLLGIDRVPVIVAEGWSEAQVRAYTIADNKLTLNAGWDFDVLAVELDELREQGMNLDLLGFEPDELNELLGNPNSGLGNTADDTVPPPPEIPVTRSGDLWKLGAHRVLCGDSCSATDARRLMAGKIALLLHADPPYGMGKEADGVANDNLYREKLDRFQMAWWAIFRPYLEHNASAYIWGNAPDLWRLWYSGGLEKSERFELRNEIVWDKKAIPGMASEDLTQYPPATERCLFFQFGQQFLSNVNQDEYPEQWEPLRGYLFDEAERAGIKPPDIRKVCGVGMYSHWFTKSQFCLIPEGHYKAIQTAYPGHFGRTWTELKAEWDRVKGTGRDIINGKLQGIRSYFDNAHDVMRDVWEFGRVSGEERYGHATPKPASMMERVMMSSLPLGGLCIEPFGGTGATLIGAERTGRVCFTMELAPVYVDVIVERWQSHTGLDATLEGDGRTFAEVKRERLAEPAVAA